MGAKIKIGDLVILREVERASGVVLWSSWTAYNRGTNILLSEWPHITGEYKKNEIAVVIETFHPKLGPYGVRICTAQDNLIGWTGAKYLKKIKIQSP